MSDRIQPYFTISRDFSPDEETVKVDVYRTDDTGLGFYTRTEGYLEALEDMDPDEFPPDDGHELGVEEERFEFDSGKADDYFRRLGNVASDFELSSPIGYNEETYRLEMFSQIGEGAELCRWSSENVPGVVKEVIAELEEMVE